MTRARTRRVALVGLATALLAFIIPTTASNAAAKPPVAPTLQSVTPTMSAGTWGTDCNGQPVMACMVAAKVQLTGKLPTGSYYLTYQVLRALDPAVGPEWTQIVADVRLPSGTTTFQMPYGTAVMPSQPVTAVRATLYKGDPMSRRGATMISDLSMPVSPPMVCGADAQP